MKKLGKKLVALGLTLSMFALPLAGCGGSGDGAQTTAAGGSGDGGAESTAAAEVSGGLSSLEDGYRRHR